MTDGTRTLIGSISALAALVAIFAIMADCSKHVADVSSSSEKACIEAGRYWSIGLGPSDVGRCFKTAK